jgi:hypothetical protein
VGGVMPPILTTTLFFSLSVDILFQDDVTVILLLGVSYMINGLGTDDGSIKENLLLNRRMR